MLALPSYAQNILHYEKEIEPFKSDSVYFLDEWVIKDSIQVFIGSRSLPDSLWEFDYISGLLTFSAAMDSALTGVKARYKTYPLTLSRIYKVREEIELDSAFFANPDSLHEEIRAISSETSFAGTDLQQNGSLSRGVIVGTNQDFSLESGLNFELHGALTENININASITDQNLPIQPDGTTQNLREFDKVFIQVEAPNTTLEMGDVDISLEQSSFARLNRRLQGAAGYSDSRFGNYTAAASVVRGNYKSMQFNGEDGVQGPYRLTGDNDEEFVIILAGTERVYINGQRVQRGAENEYIIDYGLGEVFFTDNLLIKDETRIVIEYEYVEQNFNRTLIAAEGGSELWDGKLQIGATVIRQADGDALLSQRTLTARDIELLKNVGDNLENAILSGATIADEEERENFVMYAQKDTVVNGVTYTIYEHQPGSPDAIYRVRFSNVGEDEGSYRRISSSVNGLLFQWVGPGNGNYEPFEELPAPEEQQMVSLRSRFSLSENIELFGEWAVSRFDKNRFSALDDDDNNDFAYESGFRMNSVESPIGSINAQLHRRYSGRDFQFFERTRDVEFDRKWNITRLEQSRESINEAILSISPSEQSSFGAELGYVERDDFLGIRQASFLSSNEPGIVNLQYDQDFVRSEDDSLSASGAWFRQNGLISRDFEINNFTITPYFEFEQERREQRSTITDSLAANSAAFYELGPGVRLAFSDFTINAALNYRSQKELWENELTPQYNALEHSYQIGYEPSPYFDMLNEVRFRYKNYTDTFSALESNRRSLFLKSVTSYRTKNNFIDGELFYQANTQRQAILQEIFIRVGSASGQYVWRDLNDDNVQQIDEFFPELSPNEGLYIREFLPSDELFPVVFLNFRTINAIQPFRLLSHLDEEDFLSGITIRSRVSISENSTTSDLNDVYLLRLNTFRNDSNTVQGHLNWELELDLLRNHENAELQIGYTQSNTLNQRTTEALKTYKDLFYLRSELDFAEKFTARLNGFSGLNRTISSRLASRNFNIKTRSLVPGLEMVINRSWNTGLHFTYTTKEDRFPPEDVHARIFKLTNTHRTYLWRKLQTDMRVELRTTSVSGNSSVYGSYELTEGTGEGTHVLWSLSSTYRLNNLIRFSLSYDGRTVEDRPALHTIKLVMSAIF